MNDNFYTYYLVRRNPDMCGINSLVVFLTAVLILRYQIGGQLIVTDFSFHITGDFSNKSCTGAVFTQAAVNLVQCVALCGQHATCNSVFFKQSTLDCTGCTEIYTTVAAATSLPNDVGTLHYGPYALFGQNCSATRPCIEDGTTCFPGLDTCVCDPLTSNYNEATGTCTPGCETYSDTFWMYPLYVLVGYDGEYYGGQYNRTACLEYCTQITAFTCHSVDYDFQNKICYYNNNHISSVPSAFGVWTIFDVYIRNCLN